LLLSYKTYVLFVEQTIAPASSFLGVANALPEPRQFAADSKRPFEYSDVSVDAQRIKARLSIKSRLSDDIKLRE
jgi:hypothetical protein